MPESNYILITTQTFKYLSFFPNAFNSAFVRCIDNLLCLAIKFYEVFLPLMQPVPHWLGPWLTPRIQMIHNPEA